MTKAFIVAMVLAWTAASAGFAGAQGWVDVRSGANGCPAAVGNGATDDAPAISCQIAYLNSTYAGGTVFFPAGVYAVVGGVNVLPGVWLVGTGVASSVIKTLADAAVVTFTGTGSGGTCPQGNHNGGMEKMAVYGATSASATMPTVTVKDLCNVTIRDARILYGGYGLWNDGADTSVSESFIWGYISALISHGANWYYRVKFDQPGPDTAYNAYQQGPNVPGLAGVPAQNSFVMCDFSGAYRTSSVYIDDSTDTSVTKFVASVFSSPIYSMHSRMVIMMGAELGSPTFVVNDGNLSIVGSYAYPATGITVTGGAAKSCAGNTGIYGC
jgi:hypothetical protein